MTGVREQKLMRAFGKRIAQVRDELEKRDLSDVSTDKLLAMELKLLDAVNNTSGSVRFSSTDFVLDYEGEETEIRLKLNQMNTGMEDVEELLEFGLGKLSNLAQTFQSLDDVNVRSRFQKWLFPAGLGYDGENFGTSQLPLIYRVKQNTLAGALRSDARLVIPRRIELLLPG